MPKRIRDFEPGHGFTKEAWDDVSDNPEWTAKDFAAARPFSEVLPEMAKTLKRARGRQKAPTKELVSMRLDRDTLAAYRATGAGWQGRINETLRKEVQRMQRSRVKAK